MTQEEYENKKRECWKEFKNAAINDDIPYSTYSALDYAFDRAYALGKQEKDGVDLKKLDQMLDDALEKETKESLNQWLSEKDAEEPVIQGWVARDGNGNLWAYTHKPIRSDKTYWLGEGADFTLSNDMLPDLTWVSDPLEVELIIKRKKK